MRNRTQARELALKFLYQVDLRGESLVEELEEYLAHGDHPEEILQYTRELIDGVLSHRLDLDETIQGVTENWDLNRMAIIDRNALRISVFELEHRRDIPTKVSINEAIELGKRFSTRNSGAFINGILDRIKSRLPPREEGTEEEGEEIERGDDRPR